MTGDRPNPFLRHIRHLLGEVPGAGLSDGQLLERFLADRDETAVEVLVRRYGPLVFGVCRRVLGNAHAAEDAFQATFLVLARKAPSLDRRKPIGSWLYTVAYRLALRARANEARRQACESRAARTETGGNAPPTSDLAAALEEELQRLPEKHRVPLVLCYLEGMTNDQAAQALGCPRGSMSWRLTQARDLLRERLARRGLVCPAALGSVFATQAAPAAVPLPLLHDTARAALWFAAEEGPAAGALSARAVTLAEGALKGMLMNKLKIAAGLLLLVGLLGAGAGVLVKAAPAGPPAPEADAQKRPDENAGKTTRPADDQLPAGAVARLGTTRLRHGDGIFFAAYTPDGKSLLTAGKDRTIRLWDLAGRREVRRFEPGGPDAEEPEEDGGSKYGGIDRRMLATLGMDFHVTLSADGKLLAAHRAGPVTVWQTATGRKLREIKTGQKSVDQLYFSADARSLLTLGGDHSVCVWDVASGRRTKHVPGLPKEDKDTGQVAAVSPGFRYLVWQHVERATQAISLKVRDLTTGKELPIIKAPLGGAYGLVFSPDERTLAWSGFLGGVVLWDLSTGKQMRQLGGGLDDPGNSLAFSPDGKSLAVSRANGTVELWDVRSGKRTLRIGAVPADSQPGMMILLAGMATMSRSALAFSADGSRLAASLGGPVVRQFEVATGKEVGAAAGFHQGSVSRMGLSADRKSVWTYSEGGPVRFWDLASGKLTRDLPVPGGATAIALAADGRSAAAAGKKVTLRDAAGKELRKVEAGKIAVLALALSPDGTTLATRDVLSPDVRLWDAATGKARLTLRGRAEAPKGGGVVVGETAGVVPPDLIFSPDGRFLAGAGARHELCLWEVAAGTPVWEVAPATGQAIVRFAFSANGRCLAALNGDGTVTLYETATGEQRARLGRPAKKSSGTGLMVSVGGMSLTLADRRDSPVCLAFSPDGRYLAAAHNTPDICLWDVVAGREAGRLRGRQGGVVSLLFTPDGKRLISGSTDTTALTWDLSRVVGKASAPPADREAGALWADLAGPDAVRAFEAIRRLSASPARAAALVREHVRPAAPPDPRRLARLVADLGSERFSVRRKAESELEGLGEQAAPELRKALATDPPLDLRQRIDRLVRKVSGQTPGRGLVRDLRAVELLELATGPEARRVLEDLARGQPDARLTREAKAAVERLARR